MNCGACLAQDVEGLAFQDGILSTNPTELLLAIKALAVTAVHPTLHVVSLHETKQAVGESINSFCARFWGIARNCKLEKLFTKNSCEKNLIC